MIEELGPLIKKAKALEGNGDADDIYQCIKAKAIAASTPSMGQSVCEYVQSMCHPRAWGDRYVSGYKDISEWCAFLSKLSAVSEQCWNEISKNHARPN